jgi:hypothetical protein
MPVEPVPTGEFRVVSQRRATEVLPQLQAIEIGSPPQPIEVVAPRGEVVPPRGEVVPPRGEVVPPRGEVVPPRGEVAAPVIPVDYHDPEARTIGDFRLLAMLVGAVGSGAIAWTNPDRDDQGWLIFVLIAALLGAASGEAFGFGLSRWRELERLHVIKTWWVSFSVLTVLAIAGGLVAATPYLVGGHSLSIRGALLSAVAIIGGMPIAASLAAAKQVAGDQLPGSPGQQLDILLRLRRMCARMVSQLGLLVLLVMGVNAAALDFGRELQPGVVIYSGAVASFVVGAMYVPTASTLRRRGVLFVERHFSLDNVPLAELITAADERTKLEKLLSLDQTTFGELKAGLVVLTPVVLGFVATLLPNFN